MGYKLGFLAGAGAGYVFGTRAGRTRYEQIKRQSVKAWNSDPVQSGVTSASAAAKAKAADVSVAAKAKVADAADTVKAKTPPSAHGLVDKMTSGKDKGEHHAEVATEDRNF